MNPHVFYKIKLLHRVSYLKDHHRAKVLANHHTTPGNSPVHHLCPPLTIVGEIRFDERRNFNNQIKYKQALRTRAAIIQEFYGSDTDDFTFFPSLVRRITDLSDKQNTPRAVKLLTNAATG